MTACQALIDRSHRHRHRHAIRVQVRLALREPRGFVQVHTL